jgi:adenylate cyclase
MKGQAHVQRFIDFINWPTSRKVAVYGAVCAVLTWGTPWLWLALVPDARARLDSDWLEPLIHVWSLVFLAVMLLSLPFAVKGAEARWTGYLMVVLISPFLVALIYLFGTMSSPLVAFYPCVVIMWALYFDEAMAWAGFASMMVWLAVAGVAEVNGWVPFAPLLIERTVDAQGQSVWFATMMAATLVMFLFCFVLCVFVLAARRLQAAQLDQTHRVHENINKLIRRYIPAPLLEQLGCDRPQPEALPERCKLTIVSSDIQGFTHASDELDPEDLSSILDEYLSEMMSIADRYAGTVSHVAGDGMIILFGAPRATDERDHALRAVRMASDMQERMKTLQEGWLARGFERPFQIRIGINTGVTCVGDFGSEGRRLYSAVGVQANLAVRIQSFCEPGRILVCEQTAALVSGAVQTVPKAEVPVKHLARAVPVFEVLSERAVAISN